MFMCIQYIRFNNVSICVCVCVCMLRKGAIMKHGQYALTADECPVHCCSRRRRVAGYGRRRGRHGRW